MGVIMPVTDHVKLCTATHSSIRLLMCKGTRGRGNYALFRKRMIMTGLGCCILANNAEMRLKLPWCRLQAFCFKDYLVYGYALRFVGQGCFFRLWLIRSTAPVLHTVFSAKCKIIFHKDLAFFAVHCCVRWEDGRIQSLSKKPKVRDAWICSWSGPGRFCVLTNGRVI